MKMRMFGLMALLLCVGVGQVNGSIITIDPDAAVSGTVLTNYFSGVTLTTRDGLAPGSNSRDVTAEADSGAATTGANAFAHDGGNTGWGNGLFEFFRADFVGGASQVWLDFKSNDSGGDNNAQLLAFDASDSLIGSINVGNVPAYTFVTLSVSGSNIAYIAAYWDEQLRDSNGALDNLKYNSLTDDVVPEPASIAIWSLLGILGLVVGLRRRRVQ